MKGYISKRHFFNMIGVIIVALWITLLSLLIKREYVSPDNFADTVSQAEPGDAGRDWKEIFLNGKKVGYSVNTVNPFEEGYYIQDELFLKLNLMGFEKGLYAITQAGVDTNFRLKNFYFKMNSGAINYRITGKVEGNLLKIRTGSGRNIKIKEIRLPEIPLISNGLYQLFKKVELKSGKTFRASFFDPSTLTQKDALFKVKAQEKIKINNIEYDSWKIESEMWGNKLIFWVDMNGGILKEEEFMGLTMVKSSAANAPMNIEADNADDFYELTAVQINKKLPDVKRLGLLKLEMKGIEDAGFDKNALNNGRQEYKDNIIRIRREKEPFNSGYTVPYSGDSMDMKKYLAPEYNIESDNIEIIEKAMGIAGKTKDPVAITKKMMSWVYLNLDKKPVINIPSALEVLHTKTGDCNEHATLLTALLRAAGIPARISVGLVYIRDKFFYHAWVEAYTGEWVTIDPTLNQMPADVSHVSLIRGNIDKQVEIMGLIGKIKLEVIDFEYY